MGQTFNLIFDEPYGNEQKINSVSAWNALVHFFADTARRETFWCGFSRGRQNTTTNFSFFFSELQCAPSEFNSETIRLTVYTFREL